MAKKNTKKATPSTASPPKPKPKPKATTKKITLGQRCYLVTDRKTGERKRLLPGTKNVEVPIALLEKIPGLDANYKEPPAKQVPKSPTMGAVKVGEDD